MSRPAAPSAPIAVLTPEQEADLAVHAEQHAERTHACLGDLRALVARVGPLVIAQAHRGTRNSTEYEAALNTPGHALARHELTRLHDAYPGEYAWAWGAFVSEGCTCPSCNGGGAA